MAGSRHTSVLSQAVVNGNGSVVIPNVGDSSNLTAIIFASIVGAPSGTSPVFNLYVAASPDDVQSYSVGSATGITGPNTKRIVIQNLIEPWIIISWSVTGTGASFPDRSVDLYMPGPNS